MADDGVVIKYTKPEEKSTPESAKSKELKQSLAAYNRSFQPGDMPHRLQEESSFATLFPKYREKYLQETWPLIIKTLSTFGVKCELDLREGSMTVRTTKQTWDPFAILQARDFIKLLARSVPFPQAVKVFDDDVVVDIIKIGIFSKNNERFVKRRQRLVGPGGQTLKALELVTQCYILIQGNTVAVMGSANGVQQVRKVVEDCMENIHPIYHIKTLMIKRELEKDPNMAGEDWNRFIPQFKKQHAPRKKVDKTKIKKKERTIFPPAQTPRKEDLLMESGQYFLAENERKKLKAEEKNKQSLEKMKAKALEKEKKYIAPDESQFSKRNALVSGSNTNSINDSVNALKANAQDRKTEKRKAKDLSGESVNDYIVGPSNKKKKHL